MSVNSKSLISQCKFKLLNYREELLNRSLTLRYEYSMRDFSGDEGDLAIEWNAENKFISHIERCRNQLLEIEKALNRIENGDYGICEETLEPIEFDRLLTIPWTRLSVEGAELREKLNPEFISLLA